MPYLLYVVEAEPFVPFFSSTTPLNHLFQELRSSAEYDRDDAFHLFDSYEDAEAFFFGNPRRSQLDALIFQMQEDFVLNRFLDSLTADYDSEEEFDEAVSEAFEDVLGLYALRGIDNVALELPWDAEEQDFDLDAFSTLSSFALPYSPVPSAPPANNAEEDSVEHKGVPEKYKNYTFINYEDESPAPGTTPANSANAPEAKSVANPHIFDLGDDPITCLTIENPICVPVPGTQKLRVYDEDSFKNYLESRPAAFNSATGQFTCPYTKQRISLSDTFSIGKAELQEHIKNQLTAAAPAASAPSVGQATPVSPVPPSRTPTLTTSEPPALVPTPLPVPSAPPADLPLPSAPPAYMATPAAPLSTFFSPPLNERIPAVKGVPDKYQGFTFRPENQDANNPGFFIDPLTTQPVVNPICVPTQGANAGDTTLRVYDKDSLMRYIQQTAEQQPHANGNTFKEPFSRAEISFKDAFSIGNVELAQHVREQKASAHASVGLTPRLVME